MDKLLVAVDGSNHSERVVDYAVQLSRSLSAKILLVNVTPESQVPSAYAAYAKEEQVNPGSYYVQVSQGILEHFGEKVRREGVEFEKISGAGSPAEFILDEARREGVSFIVVGIIGLHNLGRIRALGSTARRIAENSTVPVVLVP